MKHIVLQVMNDPFTGEELYKGLEPGWVQKNCFTVVQDAADDQTFLLINEKDIRGYRVGRSPDWANVFGNIQGSFLLEEGNCQLDIIVDGAGAPRLIPAMKAILNTCPLLGINLAVQIIFFADIRSPYYQAEQELYNTLKQTASDFESGIANPEFRWNCCYLLTTMTEEQAAFRKAVLPFLIQFDSSLFSMNVRACGGQIRSLDINAIEQVPMDLSVTTMCKLLLRPLKTDALSILLLCRNAAGMSQTDRIRSLQDGLDRLEQIRYPDAVDLLVQKGNPLGDTSTNDLFPKFCKDNPQSDPSFYKTTSLDELAKVPVVAKAVLAWEEQVIREGCAAGEMTPLIEMLYPNSEFDRLLRGYQKPDIMNTEIKLSEKDGYAEIAVQKLESFTDNLRKILANTIFEARLKLIRSRIPAVRNRLIRIRDERNAAVRKAEEGNRTKNVADILEVWARSISTELTNQTQQIELPLEKEDISKWIDTNAKQLLERIPAPDLVEGRRELAQSGQTIMDRMRARISPAFIPASLSGALGEQMQDKWIVYYQINTSQEHLRSMEPVVIKLSEFHMYLSQAVGLDKQLFMAPLTPPGSAGAEAARQEAKREAEHEVAPVSIPSFNEEKLETFSGELKWRWGNSSYRSARVEIYADTGAPGDMEKPVLFKTLKFSADDMYRIEGKEKLPSGVPLLIRFVYLDMGSPANCPPDEIRMKAEKTILDCTSISVTEGSLFRKKPYIRLKITPQGAFMPDHIAVASSTGHIYSAGWESTPSGESWLSELLPSMENWQVVDRPGDLIEYEIIQ